MGEQRFTTNFRVVMLGELKNTEVRDKLLIHGKSRYEGVSV
jgi:hypothetical protein